MFSKTKSNSKFELILKKTDKLLTDYFDEKKKRFIPNKTTIHLISPSYGKEEILESFSSLLNTWVTMGDKVKKFEDKFARYMGTKHAVMVNSGSSANLLALSILTNPKIKKIKRDTEVITPAVTWATTVYPMITSNLIPTFVDVDPETYTVDVKCVKDAITKKTSALMPVHLLGNSCNMDELMKIGKRENLALIEDACEAHGCEFKGRKVGSFGDIGTFSFFLSHHITTIEGGMIVTNNEKYYEFAKAMRAFGWIRDLKDKKQVAAKFKSIDERFLFTNLGFNIRPTEIQGAFGIHQIKKLDSFIKIRRNNAKYWNKRFNNCKDVFILPKETDKSMHCYFCYPLTIRSEISFSRKTITDYLEKKKIETRPIMAGNMAEQPSVKIYKNKISGSLKNSKLIMRNGFFFGNHQDVGDEEREFIADRVIEFVNENIRK